MCKCDPESLNCKCTSAPQVHPAIDWTKPVRIITQPHRKVEVLCTNGRKPCPILVYLGDDISPLSLTMDGRFLNSGHGPFVENIPPEKKKGWMNIYSSNYTSKIHPTRAKAEATAQMARVACIEIEYYEGQGV